jgi:glycosyltransferase involved in cell wall biosynthesis
MNRAIRSFDLRGFDLVLSSSHANAKNARAPAGAVHVCYCHTPMRYAWEPEFMRGEDVGRLTRLALPALLGWLRRTDLAGADGPDVFVANSRHVAERIERFYGRNATVVHPPIDVEHFLALERAPEDFYLVFGRVVPYKRVDLAVDACTQLGRPLRVAGTGRALDSIASRAGAQTELLGGVSDRDRDLLLSQARALLFPGEEDFGIVPVEAQAAGLPVIAYGVGGARESVIDAESGVLFEEQSAEAMAAAVERFETLELDESHVRESARRFGRERFRKEMADVITAAADLRGSGGDGRLQGSASHGSAAR